MEPEVALRIAHHLSLSRATSIQSMNLHPTSWRSILILFYHLHLGLPSRLFPSVFPTKILYTPSTIPHTCYTPHPTHFSRFYHPNNIGWGVHLLTFHYVVFSTPLWPWPSWTQIFSSINTLSLRSSLSVSDKDSHPYKTTGSSEYLKRMSLLIENLKCA